MKIEVKISKFHTLYAYIRQAEKFIIFQRKSNFLSEFDLINTISICCDTLIKVIFQIFKSFLCINTKNRKIRVMNNFKHYWKPSIRYCVQMWARMATTLRRPFTYPTERYVQHTPLISLKCQLSQLTVIKNDFMNLFDVFAYWVHRLQCSYGLYRI